MTKREFQEQAKMFAALQNNGITQEDAEALRRISNTLHRWFERECGSENGYIEREGENGDGKPFWCYDVHRNYTTSEKAPNGWERRCTPIPDREAGARRRLAKIMAKYPALTAYVQTDPRGAALYILRPQDMRDGQEIGSYYSSGICVY